MAHHDKNGREYATLGALVVGAAVQVDGDFDCIPAWAHRTVEVDDHGKFVRCTSGHHYLDGQLCGDRAGSLIGVYSGEAA